MKIVYIDSQNIHKGTQENGWLIDWEKFYFYTKKKYEADELKIFFGYMKKFDFFYKKLEKIGFKVYFKDALKMPNGQIKGNVDIDIAIISMIDFFENGLSEFYLLSGDGDFNTLIKFFDKKGIFRKVFVPDRIKVSSLLRKSAGSKIQLLEELKFFIEKTKSLD